MTTDTNENLEYIDILRAIAIFGVVFTHVASSILFSAKPLTSVAWWVGNVSVSASRWCVPAFVMISGALHLDPSRNIPVLSFWKKRMNRVLVPLIFWTVFYLGYRSLFGELSKRDIVHDLLLGTPFYHLWFLYMIVGLYLVTPFLQTYVKHASSKERILLIASIFVLANCSYSLNSLYFKNDSMIFTLFIPFMAYYICGYEMRLLNHHRLSYKCFISLMLACILGISIGTALLMKIFNIPRCMLLYGYFSIPVIVMSAIVFWSIQSLSNAREGIHRVMKQLIAKVKQTTFGIYLLHAAVLHIAIQIIGQQTINRHSFIAILVLTILVLFICHMIVLCIMKILYLRKIVV